MVVVGRDLGAGGGGGCGEGENKLTVFLTSLGEG